MRVSNRISVLITPLLMLASDSYLEIIRLSLLSASVILRALI